MEYVDWAWRQVLEEKGWKQSQCNGAWIRKHYNRKSEIVGGSYIPRYTREVNRLRRLGIVKQSTTKQKGEK